jgi:hypothetical protein
MFASAKDAASEAREATRRTIITNVGPNRTGSLVPESFTLPVGETEYSVVRNATKHMAEYAASTGAATIPMTPFAAAVEEAVRLGLVPGRNFVTIGPWELGIDTIDRVIYHAVYRP